MCEKISSHCHQSDENNTIGDGGVVVLVTMFQSELETEVPGLNPARNYDIHHSELEITCRYSNSRVPSDLW